MIKPFNEHGSACKGHGNNLTAETYDTKEKQDMLIKILKNYWPDAFKDEEVLDKA